MDYINPIAVNLLPQLPSIIIYIVGLWLAISRREQHPRASLAAGVYFGLALLLRAASQVYLILPLYMQQQGYSTVNIGSIFFTLNLICIPFHIVADIALLYAIFTPRSKHTTDPNTPIFVGDKNA